MIAWMDSLDLLITDMTMPVMTGIELAARFQLRWPALPVLVISGYVLDPLSLGLAGCAAFLPKPFSSGTLLDAVHHVVDSALRQPEDVSATSGFRISTPMLPPRLREVRYPFPRRREPRSATNARRELVELHTIEGQTDRVWPPERELFAGPECVLPAPTRAFEKSRVLSGRAGPGELRSAAEARSH